MNRRKLKIFGFVSLIIVSLAGSIASTISWFHEMVELSPDVAGSVQGAYYAGGDGTSGNPFQIHDPIHLYNLAWLQYFGTYNKFNDSGALTSQTYFVVTSDLDMTGWTLPPIGTEDFPFLGKFDGSGHTITGLTSTNEFGSGSGVKTPQKFTGFGDTYHQPEIVGFFGVVGKLPNDSYSYTSVNNQMINCTLDGTKVESRTSKTLIGIAAGYVNATMNGVKIKGAATIDVNGTTASTAVDATNITENLSDYGLVGYSTKTGSGGSYSQKLSKYYNNQKSDGGQGSSSGEGGSISIKDYQKWMFDLGVDSMYNNDYDSHVVVQNFVASSVSYYNTNFNNYVVDDEFELHFSSSYTCDPLADEVYNSTYSDNSYSSVSFYNNLDGHGKVGYFVHSPGRGKKMSLYKIKWSDNSNAPAGGKTVTFVEDDFATAKTVNLSYGTTGSTGNISTIYFNRQSGTSPYYRFYKAASNSGTTSSNYVFSSYHNRFQKPTTSTAVYRLRDGCYIPLKFNNNNTETHSDNTGYITGSTINDINASPKMSGYPFSYLENSLDGGSSFVDDELEILTYDTIHNYGWVAIKDKHNNSDGSYTSINSSLIRTATNSQLKTPEELGLKKYETYESDSSIKESETRPLSRNALRNIMNNSQWAYGIHFDTNYVDVNNLMTIDNAKINSKEPMNSYELPKGAITFSFPNDGYVNFFAGSYSSTSTARMNFFSLYEVDRTNNKINSIKEIVEVYENNSQTSGADKYIYKYDDNTYSDTKTTTKSGNVGKMVFDAGAALRLDNETPTSVTYSDVTQKVKVAPVHHALYYFEIPVNEGEYAMGAVSNAFNGTNASFYTQGAYMIYLDIGANSAESDTLSAYSITTKNTGNAYPIGVDFVPISVTGDGGETIAISIASGEQGSLIIATSTKDRSISVTDTSSIANYAYKSSKCVDSIPNDNQFTCNLSDGPPTPSGGGVRILNIDLRKTNGDSYYIRITDILSDDSGTIDSSTFELNSGSGFVSSTQSAIEDLSAEINLTNLRKLEIAAILSRATGTGEFVTTYNTASCTSTSINVAVTCPTGTAYSIEVKSGYTAVINGTTYTGPYPSS